MKPSFSRYRGRFAPSPTGPLHAGSLVAALASWLDARAHQGTWLVRMEDVDTPRCSRAAAQNILAQLSACGLLSDEPVLWQSSRESAYASAVQSLLNTNAAYACRCSRSDIARYWAASGTTLGRHQDTVYPGTCRHLHLQFQPGLALRFKVGQTVVHWQDRRLGAQQQHVGASVGDFVLKRSDGLWAYQLAVVVDDAAQGITHVVRGEDLADNTPRQILLQQALGLPSYIYMHTPLVLGENAEKLSKQNGAQSLDTRTPELTLQALNAAARVLDLPAAQADDCASALAFWVNAWRERWPQAQSAQPLNSTP